MRSIEVISRVIAARINIERKTAVVASLKSHAFSESVSRRGRKAVGETAIKLGLQSM